MTKDKNNIEIVPIIVPEWFTEDLQIFKPFVIRAPTGFSVQKVFDFIKDHELRPGRVEDLFPLLGYDGDMLVFPGSTRVVGGNHYYLEMCMQDPKRGKIGVDWAKLNPNTNLIFRKSFLAVSIGD